MIGIVMRMPMIVRASPLQGLNGPAPHRQRSGTAYIRPPWVQSAFKPLVSDPVTNEQRFVDLANNLIPNNGTARVGVPVVPYSNQWVTNQTYGAVWHATDWVSLTAGYFESALFSDNFGLDLNGAALAPHTGEGTDYSVRFALLDQRVNLNLIYFANRAENISSNVDATVRTELLPLLASPFVNRADYRDRNTKGVEIELVTNLARNWTLRGAFGRNEVSFTRFYPLLRAKLAEAMATAKSRGLNPDAATAVTQQYLADQEASDTSTGRKTASLTTRYSVAQGALRGFSVGGSVRRIFGKDWAAISVGGVEVLPKKVTNSQYVVSPFASYRRKWRDTTWTAQVNVNNLFDKVTDQGTAYRYTRWTDPRQIVTSVSVAY